MLNGRVDGITEVEVKIDPSVARCRSPNESVCP